MNVSCCGPADDLPHGEPLVRGQSQRESTKRLGSLRTLETISRSGAVLIVRLPNEELAERVAEAAIAGGFRALEITLSMRDRPAGGPLRTRITQGEQLLVGFIRGDPSLGRLDPFLDLGQERVSDTIAGRWLSDGPARIPRRTTCLATVWDMRSTYVLPLEDQPGFLGAWRLI